MTVRYVEVPEMLKATSIGSHTFKSVLLWASDSSSRLGPTCDDRLPLAAQTVEP